MSPTTTLNHFALGHNHSRAIQSFKNEKALAPEV